jgi:DNA-directed RNA polymerase specialized sigma subunit
MKLEEILKDEDMVRIAHKAAQSFSEVLSGDEIENCILSAAWVAVNNFDVEKNTKFSTYLYKGVYYECLKQLKQNNKSALTNRNLMNYTSSNSDVSRIDLMDEIKSCSNPDIIVDKFYGNMTLDEIAKKNGVSKETIRFKLKKDINFLKSRLS